MTSQRLRRFVIPALLAACCVTSTGCTIVGFLFMAGEEFRKTGSHIERATYEGLKDKNFAVSYYGSAPKACKAYRAKTKGKVERPFRYIRQDFFLGRTFRNMDDLNA